MTKLTVRQAEVLDCIIDCVKENLRYPTLKELRLKLEIGSNRGVVVHLDALERKRYIVRIPYIVGGIEVLRDSLGNRIKFVTEVVSIEE